MTDPDSILQLGIEAAREGNKEEARNLFRLLTSEDTQNLQAWLWLAGVSESQDERQIALEKVLELDPQNEMATKSLQALKSGQPPQAMPEPPSPPPQTAAHAETEPSGFDDFDDPFAELDALSDVFAEDSQAVGRSEPPQASSQDTTGQRGMDTDSSRDTAAGASSTAKSSSAFSREKQHASKMGREEGSKKSMSKLPVPSGINLRLVALVLAVLIVIMGLIFVVKPMLFGEPDVAVVPVTATPAAQQQPTAPPADQQPTQPPADQSPGTGNDAATGDAPADAQPPAPEGQPDDTPAAPPAPEAAPTEAAPAAPAPAGGITIIPANNPLESNGWLYDFNQNICGGNACATPWRANIGSFQAKGRFVIILVMVVNNTGQEQVLPADFMVLKDAQNRTYNALPQVSNAYVTPGINADRSHEQPIPANGIATSVALVFDVSLDATDLVLYAPSNASQGWAVLPNVQ